MMLVVRDPGQAGVEGHHDERELGQRAQQACAVPGETRLQIKLGKKKNKCKKTSCRVEEEKFERRHQEDTHHQVKHGVHGEGSMPGKERLPEEKQMVSMVTRVLRLQWRHSLGGLTGPPGLCSPDPDSGSR